MSALRTEPLLRELARGLEPVRPIPRLRSVLGVAVALCASSVVAHWLLGGPSLLTGASYWADPAFLAVFAGLILTAAGALGASLAGGVPGRESAVRAGRTAALAGLIAALGGGAAALVRAGELEVSLSLDGTLGCVLRACVLGLLPAAAAAVFLARAVGRRPRLAACVAAAGAGALGSMAVHASCASRDALHVMVAHSLGPFAAALALVPLVLAVRHVLAQDRGGRGGGRGAADAAG